MNAEIRAAREGDLAQLAAIELAAAGLFRGTGIEGAFLDEATSIEDFRDACRDGRLWVAVQGGACVGFALVVLLEDGEVWLDEIDVHPAHGRLGIGRALIENVLAWARAGGASSIALSTFLDVAWNAPFYAGLGFRALAPGKHSREIREILDDEARRGLPRQRRVVMRLELAED